MASSERWLAVSDGCVNVVRDERRGVNKLVWGYSAPVNVVPYHCFMKVQEGQPPQGPQRVSQRHGALHQVAGGGGGGGLRR